MKHFFNRICMPVLLLLAFNARAANNDLTPPYFSSSHFLNSIFNDETKRSSTKVCTCQILQVNSTNENVERLALFAEKSSNGELTREQKVSLLVLEQERKNMKSMFYSKIKLVQSITAAMDCKSLFTRLKAADLNIKMYEIVDADIRGAVMN